MVAFSAMGNPDGTRHLGWEWGENGKLLILLPEHQGAGGAEYKLLKIAGPAPLQSTQPSSKISLAQPSLDSVHREEIKVVSYTTKMAPDSQEGRPQRTGRSSREEVELTPTPLGGTGLAVCYGQWAM